MKKWFLAFGLFLAAQQSFAQAAAVDDANAEAAASQPEHAVSVTKFAQDEDIAARIQEILTATGWYENPRISVKDGVVFLDGVAGSEEQKVWARNLAAKTQDVAAVVNRMTVNTEPNWSFMPAWNEIKRIAARFVSALPLIVLALVLIPLAWFLAKGIYRLTKRFYSNRMRSPLLADITAKATAVPVILLALYVVLQVAGLTGIAVSLLGGAGVLGLVMGFAFQDIAENFLASLLLSIRHPFAAGDSIEVAGERGIVQSMNTRSTVLLSPEGNHIQIPNATVFKSIIHNYSAAPDRRNILEVGIGYDAPIAKAQNLIMRLLQAHEAVIDEPRPLVLVDMLGAATVNLKIYYWFNGARYDNLKVQSALLRQIKQVLMANDISMPDDAREVIFPNGVPLMQMPAESASIPEAPKETAKEQHEDSESVTDAEGSLSSEKEEIEAKAGNSSLAESSQNLLSDS